MYAPARPARRWPRLTAAVFAVLGLAALLLAAAAHGAGPAEDLKELRGRIQRLQKELTESEGSKAEAADALRESERAISATNRRLYDLAAEQRKLRGELNRIQADHNKLAASVRTHQDLLSRQLRQQYLTGASEPLRLMLSLRDPGEPARQLQYLTYVSRARAEQIAVLKTDLAELDALARQAQAREADLDRLQQEQARARVELEQERNKRQTVLAEVAREVARQRRELGTLTRNEERLSRLVQRLSKELAQRQRASRAPARRLRNDAVPEAGVTGSFHQLKGSLRLPVRGELANQFGSPRQGSGVAWKGVLIRARAGEEVRAVASGRVVFADWLRGFGNLLILDHGDGYLSLYAYNESLLKQVGERVGSGEPIGTVGSSGGSEETGLYFEIRYQGRPIDPLSWTALK